MASRYAAGLPAREPRRGLPGPAAAGSGPAHRGLAAAGGGGGAVVADLLEPDGHVREQDQVVIAQDDLDLGTRQVQAQCPADLGGMVMVPLRDCTATNPPAPRSAASSP